jgi:hypothetical protein
MVKICTVLQILCLLLTLQFIGCRPNDPEAPTKEELDALVQQRASQTQVERSLRGSYEIDIPGTQEWAGLQKFLEGVGPDHYEPVREAVRQNQTIIYHTTMWQQTWMFLDKFGRIESYWITAQ